VLVDAKHASCSKLARNFDQEAQTKNKIFLDSNRCPEENKCRLLKNKSREREI